MKNTKINTNTMNAFLHSVYVENLNTPLTGLHAFFYVNGIHNRKAVSPYLTNAWLVTLSVRRRINFATFVIGKVSCVLIYLTKKHYFDLSQDTDSTKTHLSNICLFWGMITMQITLSSRAPSSKAKLYVCTRTHFGLVAIKHRTPSHTVCVFSFNCHFI